MNLPCKILLVDDRPENLYALEKILADFDIEIIKALSGNEALALTLNHEFALALIDVQMPDMDGYETVRLMRNVKQTQYLPVIFISAIYSDEHYKIQGIEAGAVDFIAKPIHPQMLKGKVKVFLDLYQQRTLLEFEIEQRKQIEAELRAADIELNKALLKAEESDLLKTAFLANMSHEIRTPLNAIVGFSNLFADDSLSEEKRAQYLSYINNSSETLTTLISDIIDTAKIEAGQLEIVKSPVEVISILNELFHETTIYMERLNKANLDLEIVIPENLESFSVFTDGMRFRQVFNNLLTNASKFTHQGSIKFGFQITGENIPEFFVSDTGIGINKDQQEVIFEMFRQVPQESPSEYSGTGLGLSIVKRIVELLGGEIHLVSLPGEGSTFIFTINNQEPVKPSEPETKAKTQTEEKKGTSINKQLEILIAEDQYINFELIKEILPKMAGITWAKNGQEAIDKISQNKHFDIILMDLKMPVKTGYEAFREIRILAPEIPIIAQTAYAMEGERETILQYGFDDYISKPLKSKELLAKIYKLTNTKPA